MSNGLGFRAVIRLGVCILRLLVLYYLKDIGMLYYADEFCCCPIILHLQGNKCEVFGSTNSEVAPSTDEVLKSSCINF